MFVPLQETCDDHDIHLGCDIAAMRVFATNN